jgi:MSHA biogenesis protein MshI
VIRWFKKRQRSRDHLVVSWSGQTLVYVLARDNASRGHEVLKSGVERQEEGADIGGLEDMVRRLKALGVEGTQVSVMLRPEQYQLLRIRAPAVPPDELRAAARYQIVQMLDAHVDDVTIDVIRVGDGRPRGAGHLAGHLFVVAVPRAVIRGVLDLCSAMRWKVSVIDIQETAQRNLQSALAAGDEQRRRGRANAALMLLDPLQAVLTISANGELFYTRRFDLPRGFLDGAWDDAPSVVLAGLANPETPRPINDPSGLSGDLDEEARANRFLLEIQRSLDLWDRIWVSLPLDGISLYAGTRTQELSGWLTQRLGQPVLPMDFAAQFPGFKARSVVEEAACLPLLGLLLRTESRSL